MGFFNECTYILRKTNKDMILVKSEDKLTYSYFKNSDSCTFSENLTLFPIDFSNYHFDIDANDVAYGIFVDSSINILKFNNNNNKFSLIHKISYDNKNFAINFPYIKYVNDQIHIIYYLTSRNHPTTILFHHYNDGYKWIENKIDFINLPLLDNFVVCFNNSIANIFYFKESKDFPQIYTSSFCLNSLSWNKPLQITNSYTNKIYLSILKDKLNFYHLAFCDKSDGKYFIRYLNGYLNNNNFEEMINTTINTPSIYLFPSIVKYNSDIFISYVNENILYTRSSKDLGETWSDSIEDYNSINDKFIRGYLRSNYCNDLDYTSSCLFISKNPFGILGNFV